MSQNVNFNLLRKWLVSEVGNSMTTKEAQKMGISDEFREATTELDKTVLQIDDILEDKDLYHQVQALYVSEQAEKKEETAKDEEKKKEEKNKVGEKQPGKGA